MRNRYVDIERLKDKFISLDWSVNKWVNDVDIFLALSHADLEPVVRCKDCVFKKSEHLCMFSGAVENDGFCHRGKSYPWRA